ncbi:hypothetical protein [Dietzia cercidiphylli]|nr:hypothetical protein [Dietzia cercidiphylli]
MTATAFGTLAVLVFVLGVTGLTTSLRPQPAHYEPTADTARS